MEKKMTKREMFAEILKVQGVAENAEMVAFIEHEIELLENKKSKSGATKTQKENVEIKAKLLAELSTYDKAVTITEFMQTNSYAGTLSNQKISALLRQLGESGLVEKAVVKGKSYFKAVATEEVTIAVDLEEVAE